VHISFTLKTKILSYC